MSQFVLNSSFIKSSLSVPSNGLTYFQTGSTNKGTINDWSWNNITGNIVIVDGTGADFKTKLPKGNKALGLQCESTSSSAEVMQSIYFTKGTYNLQFRTLYRGGGNNSSSHYLTVDISNGTNNVLNKILDGNKTVMNKINIESATSDWTDTDYTKSLKSYDFYVTADGNYNLKFKAVAVVKKDSTIFLTNVLVVNKYLYVLNGDFNTPDISYNSADDSVRIWTRTGVASNFQTVDGNPGYSGIYLPPGKQGFFIKQIDNTSCTLNQTITFKQGDYNLNFRALYRFSFTNSHTLSVIISNSNSNSIALSQQLNGSQNGMNKLIDSTSTTSWTSAQSYKSYYFNIYSDGSYTLSFQFQNNDPNVSAFNYTSGIVLTDVVIEPQLPKPWGVYIAGHPNNIVNNSLQNVSGTLFDITGLGRHAVIGGSIDASFTSGSGNGASVSVPQIQGGSGTKIIWPDNSAPFNNVPFTLSSITRYTTDLSGLILVSTSGKLIHGHQGKPGIVVYSNAYKVNNRLTYVNNKTDWVVVCGTNNTNVSIPNNILINNTAYGISNGGGNSQGTPVLTINDFAGGAQASDFAFQQLVIWNFGLDADQLLRISTLQNNYLQTGTIQYPFSIISTRPVITSVTSARPETGLVNFSINFTIAAVGALDASFTYLYSTDGGKSFADSLQIESPITINRLSVSIYYEFVIKHISTAGESAPSNIAVCKDFESVPTNVVATPVYGTTNSIRVSFDAPTVLGYPPRTQYQYSLNTSDSFYPASNLEQTIDASKNAFTITSDSLSGGTSYLIYVRSALRVSATYNWNGTDANVSARTNSLGTPPQINTVTSTQANQARITYSQSAIGTSDTSYSYYLTGLSSPVFISNASNGTFDVSDLRNTTRNFYSLYILASNPGGDISSESQFINFIGSKPFIRSITPGTNKLTIDFSQNIQGTSQLYYYSDSSNGSNPLGPVTSPFDISNITTPRTVYIVASNLAGNLISDGSSGTPYIFGSAPTIGTITPGTNQLSVAFSQSSLGTSPTTYYYSTDGTTKLGSGVPQSPLTITGISSEYVFYVIASNAAGDIRSLSTARGTPYVLGSAPTIISVTPLSNKLTVEFSVSIGGYPPPTYFYSLDGDAVYTNANNNGTTFEITIPPEKTANTHSVKMIARNEGGDTAPSNEVIVRMISPSLYWASQYWSTVSYWRNASYWSKRK